MDIGNRPRGVPGLIVLLAWLACAAAAWAAPRQLGAHRWDGVERIVAIGDLHGDFDRYLAVLQAAGVVDPRGRWSAGATHLVQTGDIPDRGPDTRRIIAHMASLAEQARKRGGRVHNLLGNHEAMNVYGDLRYVDPGEFSAFADARSSVLRDRYYKASLEDLAKSDPQRHAALPDDHRVQWDREHPPGWVEHRLAWDPRWDPKGALYLWARNARVAIQLNDLVFVHGGISASYCGHSLEALTSMARAALADPGQAGISILQDESGPLWYRGLAGVAPATSVATVDAILRKHGAKRIVIGHTPTSGVIWPRLGGRVIMIDTGLGAAYGGHLGWLEVDRGVLRAGYAGGRLPLPLDDAGRANYLDAVIALHPTNEALKQRREALRAGTLEGGAAVPGQGDQPGSPVICGTSP